MIGFTDPSVGDLLSPARFAFASVGTSTSTSGRAIARYTLGRDFTKVGTAYWPEPGP
jgi:hypothetical protein